MILLIRYNTWHENIGRFAYCPGVPARDRWQASQNFAALAGVVRDAMNLPRKKIRTSLGVLSEVDNNINALTTLPWGKNASGEEQHQHAR